MHLSRNVRKNNHRKWVAKAFAMTGWRIGYIGAPEFIQSVYKNSRSSNLRTNSIAQRATITAVDADPMY
jgi:aspartate aminotransferase